MMFFRSWLRRLRFWREIRQINKVDKAFRKTLEAAKDPDKTEPTSNDSIFPASWTEMIQELEEELKTYNTPSPKKQEPEIAECLVQLEELDAPAARLVSESGQPLGTLASLEDTAFLGVDKPGVYTAIVEADPGNDDALLSHEALCVVHPDQYRLFAHIPDLKERARLINRFKTCDPLQQQSIIPYARRSAYVPEETTAEAERKTQRYTIKDPDKLILLFEMCKHSLPDNLRLQCQELIHKIHTHSIHSGNTVNDAAVALADILYTCNEANEKKPFLSTEECWEVFRKMRYGDDPWIHTIIKQLRLLDRCDHTGTVFVLVGKPGTGKTSIAEAIAICTHKKFVAIECDNKSALNLGGLDKMYADANHGTVQEAFLNYGTNLVVLLDEPDKMVKTEKEGDPFSLFVSTWDDRKTFTDTFTKAPVSTKDTIFVLALNDIEQVPDYILNRFHENVFVLDDYTPETKAEIGKRFIVPKFMRKYHFTEADVQFTDEGLLAIARSTPDQGARITEQRINYLFGEVNAALENGSAAPVVVDAAYAEKALQNANNHREPSHFTVGF